MSYRNMRSLTSMPWALMCLCLLYQPSIMIASRDESTRIGQVLYALAWLPAVWPQPLEDFTWSTPANPWNDPNALPPNQTPRRLKTFNGTGFSTVVTSHAAQFTHVGSVMPTRGAAHLQSSINVRAQYEMADKALGVARKLFTAHLASLGIMLPDDEIYSTGNPPVPAPPRPEEIFTLRNENYIRTYTQGDASKFTALQAFKAFHYICPELRQQLLAAWNNWAVIDKQVYTQAKEFNTFMTNHHMDLMNQIRTYLEENNGPHPHIRQNQGLSIFNVSQENFALDFGQLLHKASSIKLQAAAQLDLTAKVGESTIFEGRLYQEDVATNIHQVTQNEALSKYGMTPDNPFGSQMSPNPTYAKLRDKRLAVAVLMGLVSVIGLTTASTVMGSYSISQLRKLDDQLHKQDQKIDIVTRQVETNAGHIQRLYNQIQAMEHDLFKEITQMKHSIRMIRMGQALSHHLDEISSEVQKTSSMLDALASNRVSSAFASSYALHRSTQQLREDAEKLGNQLLIERYGDVFQCEASFRLTAGFLNVYVHIPIGRVRERMSLWSFQPFPFTGYNGSISYIEKKGHYLATNKDRSLFKGFSSEELLQCNKVHKVHVCPAGMILRDTASVEISLEHLERSPEMCLFALFHDRTHLVPRVCTLTVAPPTTIISRLNSNTFRVATKLRGEAKVQCANGGPPEVFPLHRNFDITVATNCHCKFGTFYLFGGDILEVEVKIHKTVTMEWDPAEIFQIDNAEMRFLEHNQRVGRSITDVPWQPEGLVPIPGFLQKYLDVATRPSVIVSNVMMGAAGIFLAVLALFLTCFVYRHNKKEFNSMARNARNSMFNLAASLHSPAPRQTDPSPRRRTRQRPRSNSFQGLPLTTFATRDATPFRRNSQDSGLASIPASVHRRQLSISHTPLPQIQHTPAAPQDTLPGGSIYPVNLLQEASLQRVPPPSPASTVVIPSPLEPLRDTVDNIRQT